MPLFVRKARCAALGVLVGAWLAPTEALSQNPAAVDPNVLRPPTILNDSARHVTASVAGLFVGRIVQSIQAGDTTALSSLIPLAAIPDSERVAVQQLGCSGLGGALAKLNEARLRRTGRFRTARVLTGADYRVSVEPSSSSLAEASLSLVVGGEARPVWVTFTRDAGALKVGQLRGGLLAICRIDARLAATSWLSVGVHHSGVIGGSIEAASHGRQRIDLLASRRAGSLRFSLGAGVFIGSLWRFSETRSGFAMDGAVVLPSRVELGLGVARSATRFGGTNHEWSKSVTAGVHLAAIRVGVRYADTALGLGSGYGVSVGYEPRMAQPR
jgi:hypothetical protein